MNKKLRFQKPKQTKELYILAKALTKKTHKICNNNFYFSLINSNKWSITCVLTTSGTFLNVLHQLTKIYMYSHSGTLEIKFEIY